MRPKYRIKLAKHIMFDVFTGQIMHQELINPCGIANRVYVIKSLLNDQKYTNIKQ